MRPNSSIPLLKDGRHNAIIAHYCEDPHNTKLPSSLNTTNGRRQGLSENSKQPKQMLVYGIKVTDWEGWGDIFIMRHINCAAWNSTYLWKSKIGAEKKGAVRSGEQLQAHLCTSGKLALWTLTQKLNHIPFLFCRCALKTTNIWVHTSPLSSNVEDNEL